MDNINDLVGDAAKQLMAQADGIQNPRLKESAKRVALTVSAKTRDETITKARNAAFARIPIWAFFLPVTRRQQIVLGRIYSFQCTTNKDGSPAEYRMSLSTGASVERDILNNRNWCQHFLKAMCMADADIEFIGEDNVPSASYTYVVTGAYDNFGGKVSIGAEEYLSRINIKVYEGDENGNLVFEGGAAECLAWADGYCGDC